VSRCPTEHAGMLQLFADRDGACIIRGTPIDYASVERLAERVSTVQRTIYGTTFEVAVSCVVCIFLLLGPCRHYCVNTEHG
jgi:hypothetical protein